MDLIFLEYMLADTEVEKGLPPSWVSVLWHSPAMAQWPGLTLLSMIISVLDQMYSTIPLSYTILLFCY